jgi:hypothetical protein
MVDEDALGKTIAAAINEAVAPLRKRIENLEVRATMADHLKQFEMRNPATRGTRSGHDG